MSAVPAASTAQGDAPGGPGTRPSWLPADKTGFGTARDHAGDVWFTLQGGRMSEVCYPDLSTPSVRLLDVADRAAALALRRGRPGPDQRRQ
ncbi:hypothetical protein [Amycolatopsis sp. NPDC001319]|uniref:hypothetical protein n=1 Tax=unclassified Amycolatopsis TaxID=2618356 RepID=UPI00368270F6